MQEEYIFSMVYYLLTKVSLNFFGFINPSKKSISELRKCDRAISWDFGTTIDRSKIWINIIIIEIQKKKFIILILLTPWFQKMINSLFASYLINV